jgi:CheY-like chemotaxis protein
VHSNPTGSPAAHCIVVDDDPQVRSALSRVLESQGLACLEAENGEVALALLESHGELAL